ncbi:MAG: alpha-amylase family glycosyl hydrolase [Chitinophagales bacterium]|nr:alpha-glucosidase C-terminal domain-containing protein [Bacteroidota bacterium]
MRTFSFVLMLCLGTCFFTKNVPAQTLPVWAENANIYEVNIRQYTPEGTFKAFQQHLPRLKAMGVDILWLMPIHPIGVEKRKGSLGSYYSVKDYRAVNPEYGDMKDFRELVNAAHNLGMYVIIDWVANHTSWDNALLKEHPKWYTRDKKGNIKSPVDDWHDVADLNYDEKDLWKYMQESFQFWVDEARIDGFRCDVAEWVPLKFWEKTIPAINKTRPLFWLAEAENPELHPYFNMTYAWNLHHLMNDIAKGNKNVYDLDTYFEKENKDFKKSNLRMQFITNHDENSWNGTEFERMGDAWRAMAAFSFVVPGMPLLYNGQEVGLDKRLAFFDKDVIDWNLNQFVSFYDKLLALKKRNRTLLNGENGGDMEILKTTSGASVFAFARETKSEHLVAIFNFSAVQRKFTVDFNKYKGNYTNALSGEHATYNSNASFELAPWDFVILEQNCD